MSLHSHLEQSDDTSVGERIGQNWFHVPLELGLWENLTEMVHGSMHHVSPFGNDDEYRLLFDQIARGLHRQSSRHVLIRRERGVGDHAVLAEFARQCDEGKYTHLRNMQFLRTDLRFSPPDAIRSLLNAIFVQVASKLNVIICLDNLAVFLASDSRGNRSMLFSLLAKSPCRVIGLVTPQEYEEYFSGFLDTEEFFFPVDVAEPSLESAYKLVRHFANGLSKQYSVNIDDSIVSKTVLLSDSFIPSSRLPAKAVRIIRNICDEIAFERNQKIAQRDQITDRDVVNEVSAVSAVPADTIAGLPNCIDYRTTLSSRIFGQDKVIEEVAIELGLIRSGMVDSDKPASVMLFVGQTGTGKTELAKVISQLYSASKRLKTFTLGNYSEPHSVSGIIGVPAGYVGHEQGGRLVNELNADPYSVFLLDEADKAHPDVMQPFLNLFDEGWIVDQRGVRGFAERAIFILTTNVGQRQIAEMQKKGKSWDEIHSKLMESLSQIRHAKANRPIFSAELLARIKRVILFEPLDASAMQDITRQLCCDLEKKWSRLRQQKLSISEDVIAMIAETAIEKNEKSAGKEGGRIVRKIIANEIEAKLLSELANISVEHRRHDSIEIGLCDHVDPPKLIVRFA